MQVTLGFQTHKLSLEQRRGLVEPTNPKSPFHSFIGNRKEIEPLWLAAVAAFGDETHNCADQSYAILGPASVGKTMLARCFAQTVKLPFVEVQPQAIKTVGDLLNLIDRVCSETPVPGGSGTLKLTPPDPSRPHRYTLPCMIVFIDEVHLFKGHKRVILESLLKAIEHDDREMVTEKGFVIDTSRVCWIIATTDRGDLPEAFDTRFVKIHLKPYNKEEMQAIVKSRNPDWDDKTCKIAALYGGPVPREVLSFIRMMRLYRKTQPKKVSWEAIAEEVRLANNIDQWGVSEQRIKILTALGQRPIAQGRLPLIAGCQIDELVKFVMPPMMAATSERSPLSAWVAMTSEGYSITPTGQKELDKRGIPHQGIHALAKDVQDLK